MTPSGSTQGQSTLTFLTVRKSYAEWANGKLTLHLQGYSIDPQGKISVVPYRPSGTGLQTTAKGAVYFSVLNCQGIQNHKEAYHVTQSFDHPKKPTSVHVLTARGTFPIPLHTPPPPVDPPSDLLVLVDAGLLSTSVLFAQNTAAPGQGINTTATGTFNNPLPVTSNGNTPYVYLLGANGLTTDLDPEPLKVIGEVGSTINWSMSVFDTTSYTAYPYQIATQPAEGSTSVQVTTVANYLPAVGTYAPGQPSLDTDTTVETREVMIPMKVSTTGSVNVSISFKVINNANGSTLGYHVWTVPLDIATS